MQGFNQLGSYSYRNLLLVVNSGNHIVFWYSSSEWPNQIPPGVRVFSSPRRQKRFLIRHCYFCLLVSSCDQYGRFIRPCVFVLVCLIWSNFRSGHTFCSPMDKRKCFSAVHTKFFFLNSHLFEPSVFIFHTNCSWLLNLGVTDWSFHVHNLVWRALLCLLTAVCLV